MQTYNSLGQRVLKTLPNSSKEIYHYDEAGHLITVTDQAGVTLRDYIYWGDQQTALTSNGTTYYIHNDHLNTPQVITNQSQQVVWMGDYEPFGKVASNANNSIEIFSRFPGQYLDNETGLYYNYFRDYDPSIGRYIESDPIGLRGGINTYAYVRGNPLIYSDPTGETPVIALQRAWSVGQWGGRGFNYAWESVAGQTLGGSIYDWVHDDDDSSPYDDAQPVPAPSPSPDNSGCEQDCDLKWDRDKFKCDSNVATNYGWNSVEYVFCMKRVNKIYLDCLQECEDEDCSK